MFGMVLEVCSSYSQTQINIQLLLLLKLDLFIDFKTRSVYLELVLKRQREQALGSHNGLKPGEEEQAATCCPTDICASA